MIVGETLSHYRIMERLGRGGMGEVFLAEDLRLHRPVALKVLGAEARGDGEARARLVREARAASALNHPGIAVIYEIDEVEQDGAPLGLHRDGVRGRRDARGDEEPARSGRRRRCWTSPRSSRTRWRPRTPAAWCTAT